jgi:DNA-binding PadR family transcriptional regulator
MTKRPDEFLPLLPAMLHILSALAGEPRHGYGIMQEVLRQSGDTYKLGPGTLYDNLQRLMDQGLVEEVATRASDADSRRRTYRLNALGRSVLQAELNRLEGLIRETRLRLPQWKPRRA